MDKYPPSMRIQDIENELPAGFRFCPNDEELVCHYLYNKVYNQEDSRENPLLEVDLHTCEPWQLPDIVKVNSEEWYFFSCRDRKYAMGFRINRATPSGYWKGTGKDRAVVESRSGKIVGMRKTLVYHRNRAPNGIKTGWIMHEFRLWNATLASKDDWVLCRVYHRSSGENSNTFRPLKMYNLEVSHTSDQTPLHDHEPFTSVVLDFPAPDPSISYENETDSGQDIGFLLDGSMEMMTFDLDTSQMLL